jgi:hypothetical protein
LIPKDSQARLERAGLTVHLPLIVSVEESGSFQPRQETYQLAFPATFAFPHVQGPDLVASVQRLLALSDL